MEGPAALRCYRRKVFLLRRLWILVQLGQLVELVSRTMRVPLEKTCLLSSLCQIGNQLTVK